MMKRRIQVFIGEEASAALDQITATGMSQTQTVELAILRLYRRDYGGAQSNGGAVEADPRDPEIIKRQSTPAEMAEARAGLKAVTGAMPDFPEPGHRSSSDIAIEIAARETIPGYVPNSASPSELKRLARPYKPLERGKVEPLTKPGKISNKENKS